MGFFQDLKQDLSQTVTDNMPEDIELEGDELAMSTDTAPISSEDLFGQPDSEEFKDLEAMLEQEVAALGGAPEGMVQAPVEEVKAVDHTMEAAASEEVEELLNEVEQNMAEPAYIEKEEPNFRNTKEQNFFKDSFNSMQSSEISTDTAVITAGMTITGDVISSGNMDLVGSINGNIEINGKLNVTGSINGNSSAAEIYAESAQINGEVKSKGSVKIGQSSVVIGNIFATSAVIAGAVKGDIDVHGPVILDTSAIVMGNIKSKSVQINNGAVIEGFCSQSYFRSMHYMQQSYVRNFPSHTDESASRPYVGNRCGAYPYAAGSESPPRYSLPCAFPCKEWPPQPPKRSLHLLPPAIHSSSLTSKPYFSSTPSTSSVSSFFS